MYKMFVRNFKNYWAIADGHDCYRTRIAEVLVGLADYDMYLRWKQECLERYKEVNNLVYHIAQNIDKYYTFETFSRDLWGYGYDAIKDDTFSQEIIVEQLKLIHCCLRGQYYEK